MLTLSFLCFSSSFTFFSASLCFLSSSFNCFSASLALRFSSFSSSFIRFCSLTSSSFLRFSISFSCFSFSFLDLSSALSRSLVSFSSRLLSFSAEVNFRFLGALSVDVAGPECSVEGPSPAVDPGVSRAGELAPLRPGVDGSKPRFPLRMSDGVKSCSGSRLVGEGDLRGS